MNFPKVLILNQPFNNNTGGGITLSNLFSGWDRRKLAVACSGYLLADNIDTHICNTYYQLGNKERKWIFPLRYFKRRYTSGLIKFQDKRFENLTISKSKLRVKFIMDIMFPVFERVGLLHCISKTGLSPELCNWLDEYQPDVIYAQAGSREDILFCNSVQNYLEKPMIFHMMDDWVSMVGEKGLLKGFWKKKIDNEFRGLIEKATILMSISEYMAKEYKVRYGKNFATFHNPINIDFWKKYQKNNYELSNSPTILYAGRIGLGIYSSLEVIAEAITKVNKELKTNIKLKLQTSEKPDWIKKFTNVLHVNFIAYEDLPKAFSEMDILLLPYDFSKESIRFIRYSMPTKAPEYMMSGTPILLFSPKETAITKFCQKHNCAKVVSEFSLNDLSNAIIDLIKNKSERELIAKNAVTIAEEKHNASQITKNFRDIIFQVGQTIGAVRCGI